MAFKFIPIIVAGFIIHFGTAVAEDHKDCFNYSAKDGNRIYNKCRVTDSKNFLKPRRLKCVAKEIGILNKDRTINKEKLQSIIKNYAYPEHQEKILKVVDDALKKTRQNFYSSFINGVIQICPKDQKFGNPKI